MLMRQICHNPTIYISIINMQGFRITNNQTYSYLPYLLNLCFGCQFIFQSTFILQVSSLSSLCPQYSTNKSFFIFPNFPQCWKVISFIHFLVIVSLLLLTNLVDAIALIPLLTYFFIITLTFPLIKRAYYLTSSFPSSNNLSFSLINKPQKVSKE